jgi:hypothetical protein
MSPLTYSAFEVLTYSAFEVRKNYIDEIYTPSYKHLCLDDMMSDLSNVIKAISAQYTDHTSQMLQTDILVSEGYHKLSKIIDRFFFEKDGKFYLSRLSKSRLPTRGEFFAFFKVSFKNHIKGLVQKYRFTEKRTGRKVGDEDGTKNVELSLDDPDIGLQYSDTPDYRSHTESYSVLKQDIVSLLNPLETLVFNQLAEPNDESHIFAKLDQIRKKRSSSKIKAVHMAMGLGMTPELFEAVQNQIKAKVELYMSDNAENTKYNAALQTLENIFGVKVPRSMDSIIVRRLLTIAARDQHDKVTDDVAELLTIVGAKPPKKAAGNATCFGVLFQNNHRVCMACGLKSSCATECSNIGLGDITISPKLLSSRQLMRIPAVTGEPTSDICFLSERDDDIYNYLCENFKRIDHRGDIHFKHRESNDKPSGFVVSIDPKVLKFRINSPSDEIAPSLDKINDSYVIPDSISSDEAIDLIAKHAEERYAASVN